MTEKVKFLQSHIHHKGLLEDFLLVDFYTQIMLNEGRNYCLKYFNYWSYQPIYLWLLQFHTFVLIQFPVNLKCREKYFHLFLSSCRLVKSLDHIWSWAQNFMFYPMLGALKLNLLEQIKLTSHIESFPTTSTIYFRFSI